VSKRRKRHSSLIRGAALLVIAAGAVLFFLPRPWIRRLGALTQILLPFQHAASSAADSLSPEPGLDSSAAAKAAAEHQAAALAARVQQLEAEVKLLTATRLWDINGQKIGAKGALIPARVIAGDLLPWRSSRLIDSGTATRVSAGDPVLSAVFTIDRGADEGARGGLAIVAGETLIGFIDHAAGQSARVRLLSDPQSAMKVRIGRVTDHGLEGPDRYFWLAGRGPGRMEIEDAEMQDAQDGRIRPGDLVLSDPEHELLPAALVIGSIERIDVNRDKPLFAVLSVRSAVDEKPLRRVYVYDPGAEVDSGIP
jgi:cell shape-determining protein MreC